MPPWFSRIRRIVGSPDAAWRAVSVQSHVWVPRLVLTLVPAMILAGIAASTVWGHNGLIARAELQANVDKAGTKLAGVQRENQRLLRELTLMNEDPVVLERMVAEELMLGRPGATIYRFDAPSTTGTGVVGNAPAVELPAEAEEPALPPAGD